MSVPRILCVGALTLDTNYRLKMLPHGGGKVLANSVAVVPAGMASSAAIAAARLGGDVSLWASAGDDAAGETLLAGMTGHGVNCRHVRRVAGSASATATVLVDADGERIVIAHYPLGLLQSPADGPAICEFNAVLADARWPAAAALALGAGRAAGVPAIFDLDVAEAAVLRQLAPLASHVVASAAGAAIATGETDERRALDGLVRLGGGFAAITLGAGGCIFMAAPDAPVRHVEAPRVEVVDSNAAGDVFHGAFAVALAEGQEVEEALRFASGAAALKCTRFGGAAGAPTRAELRAFLAGTRAVLA